PERGHGAALVGHLPLDPEPPQDGPAADGERQPLPAEPQQQRQPQQRDGHELEQDAAQQHHEDGQQEPPGTGGEHRGASGGFRRLRLSVKPQAAGTILYSDSTGTESSNSWMMSRGRRPSTSASGRTIRRWPRTPAATAWTSSWVK